MSACNGQLTAGRSSAQRNTKPSVDPQPQAVRVTRPIRSVLPPFSSEAWLLDPLLGLLKVLFSDESGGSDVVKDVDRLPGVTALTLVARSCTQKVAALANERHPHSSLTVGA